MIAFYPEVRLIHIAAVVLSGSLFALRGLMMLARSRTANAAPLRWLSYVVDTTLLAAALALVAMLHQYPFVQAWLTAKVLLLVVYIVLGVFALRRGRTLAVRATCYVAALAVYLFIISIARAHDPRGFLLPFLT
ncbi:MAG: SirB2 family protein [Pseudomonadota bacterium]|jgi:uncharacterized membrane protein SirB2|nr:SirB2 family protein [Pseudomonadota bacterium]